MIIKRFLSYLGMALAFAVLPFSAYASERISYSIASAVSLVQPYGECAAKYELSLAQWRTGVGAGEAEVKSNLIAISNHFGMSGAAPFGVPDWDGAANA